MSAQENSDTSETLFSFELLVEYIRIDEEVKVSDELALGVRLLDFPTLLIYQPEQSGIRQHEHLGEDNRCGYTFNRGKSCLFKINLDSLHTRLSNTPLYAMVLDVKEDIPKLVGTSLISLAGLVDRIRLDVNVHGVSTPSSQGERVLVGIFNLMGEKVGSISLGYKLRSLGASLLPHISESRACKISGGHGGQDTQGNTKEPSLVDSEHVQSPKLDNKSELCKNIQMNGASNEKILINKAKQGDAVCVATQTEHRPRGQMHHSFQENDYNSEEEITLFCPPQLFYRSSVDKTSKNEVVDSELLNLDLESFVLEDVCSEDETPEFEIEHPRPPVTDQRMRHIEKMTSNQETIGVTPTVLGEALRQLPLLNALLVELSQLNGQSQQQPMSVHPNLAWIYKPSTEPSPGQNTLPKAQTKLLHKTRQVASPRFKDLHSPKRCSTPVSERKREDAFLGSKPPRTSTRKKLVYGTTKTFRLRLKQIPPGVVKRHECMETQTETQTKGKTLNTSSKTIKHTKRRTTLNQSSNLDEHIETVVSSIAGDSALQETSRHKNKDANKFHRSSEVGTLHCKHDDDSQNRSEKHSHSEADMKLIYIPSVVGEDVAQSRDKNSHRSESSQMQPESDRNIEKTETARSSPKSSYSDSSRGGKEEGEYVDDFTSLDPSDGYSPDPLSSPEPALAKMHKSPIPGEHYSSDSASEGTRRRAAFPVPVKAYSSPQRSLRGTHIIRPRTQASALSLSSDNDGGDGSASIHTVLSRNQTTKSGRTKGSSVTDSLRSSRSQRSDSTRNSAAVRGLSAESMSSFEPQEVEELEDELCSLDFKNKYQHISELVANKLPGYTV